jgi:hypothetical protein
LQEDMKIHGFNLDNGECIGEFKMAVFLKKFDTTVRKYQ